MLNLFSCFVENSHPDKGGNRKTGWEVITTFLAEVIDAGLDEVKISRAANHLISFEGQPTEFADRYAESVREQKESRMTPRFLARAIERWNCPLLQRER